MTVFHATKNRSQGRAGWCAIFHHPLRQSRDGKPVRVRRGLATRDDAEADRRVEQLNRLLSERAYWSPTARARAEREIDMEVVKIFYDGLDEIEGVDGWKSRDAVIELPDRTSGYTRVLVLGSTGAGKTTVVRQLIGSEPRAGPFPFYRYGEDDDGGDRGRDGRRPVPRSCFVLATGIGARRTSKNVRSLRCREPRTVEATSR